MHTWLRTKQWQPSFLAVWTPRRGTRPGEEPALLAGPAEEPGPLPQPLSQLPAKPVRILNIRCAKGDTSYRVDRKRVERIPEKVGRRNLWPMAKIKCRQHFAARTSRKFRRNRSAKSKCEKVIRRTLSGPSVQVRVPVSRSGLRCKYSSLLRIWSILTVCDGSPAAPFRFATSSGSTLPGGFSFGGW